MAPSSPTSLYEALSGVIDRRQYNTVHPLPSVLALCICAMLCGARSKLAVAQWGRDHGEEIAARLGFRRRTPCHASIHNILTGLDVDAFEIALSQWIGQFLPPGKRRAVAVDGKTLRGIHGEELPGVHLVAAFAQDLGLPLAQRKVATKEGELVAARQLLDTLDLHGVVITGDALYCQRDLCEQIVQKGGTTSSRSSATSPTSCVM